MPLKQKKSPRSLNGFKTLMIVDIFQMLEAEKTELAAREKKLQEFILISTSLQQSLAGENAAKVRKNMVDVAQVCSVSMRK